MCYIIHGVICCYTKNDVICYIIHCLISWYITRCNLMLHYIVILHRVCFILTSYTMHFYVTNHGVICCYITYSVICFFITHNVIYCYISHGIMCWQFWLWGCIPPVPGAGWPSRTTVWCLRKVAFPGLMLQYDLSLSLSLALSLYLFFYLNYSSNFTEKLQAQQRVRPGDDR